MSYVTTSTLLTWVIFTPAIGIGAVLLLLALRPLLRLPQSAIDQSSRVIGFLATTAASVLAVVLWRDFDGQSADQYG